MSGMPDSFETDLVPTMTAEVIPTAYSVDDIIADFDTEHLPASHHRVAVIAGVIIATAAAVTGGVLLFGHEHGTLTNPRTAQSSSVQIPPPVIVPPVAAPSAPAQRELTDDERFVARLLSWGSDTSPSELPRVGHAICRNLQAGETAMQVRNELIAATPGMDEATATHFVRDAMDIYGCHA